MGSSQLKIVFITKANLLINYAKQQIGSSFHGLNISYQSFDPKAVIASEMDDDVDVVLADPTIKLEVFKNLPKSVKWVQFTWAGLDSLTKRFDENELSKFKPNFLITRLGRGFTRGMADYVLAQVIGMERNFKLTQEKQRVREWITNTPQSIHNYRTVSDLTMGVLGAGDIGMVVAQHFKSLGAKVIAVKRTIPTGDDHGYPVDKFYSNDELDEFLSSCDYFCNVLPHTPETVDLLSGDRLKACQQRQAGFVNIGRGSVIDEASIVRALENGWIRGAVLDVFCEEPLPEESALWSAPNCSITPHLSGSSYDESGASVFVDNFKRFVKNQPLLYVYDWRRMY